jgi:hypothetical protein
MTNFPVGERFSAGCQCSVARMIYASAPAKRTCARSGFPRRMVCQTLHKLRRIIRLAAILNLAYFGIEFAVARAIGSVSRGIAFEASLPNTEAAMGATGEG